MLAFLTSYGQLQFKLLNRQFRDIGLAPLIAYALILAFVIFASIRLFDQYSTAPFILMTTGAYCVSILHMKRRNYFLKNLLSRKQYVILRFVENIMVSLPFAIVLMANGYFLFAIGFCMVAAALSTLNLPEWLQKTIPTPFYKFPYEFAVGFRNTWWAITILYAVGIIGIVVDNSNLSLVVMGILGFCVISYYGTAEPTYYVWVHAKTPQQFLWYKFKIALQYYTVLLLPYVAMCSLFFWDDVLLFVSVAIVAIFYLAALLLVKYTNYPEQPHLGNGILFACCIGVPPLLLLFIPYFYSITIKKLSVYLK
jgi:hypothetical protein